MYCTKCGRNNPDKNKFCNGCGAKFVIVAESKFVLIETELPPPPPPPPASRWTVPLEPEPAVEGDAGTVVSDSPEVEYGEDIYGGTMSVPDTDLTGLDIAQAVRSATVEATTDAEMDHARDAVLTDPDPSSTASDEGLVAELEDSEKVTVNVAELSNAASVPQDTSDTEIPENTLETAPDREILPEKAAILTDATPTDLAEKDESSIVTSLETKPAPTLVDELGIINQEEAHDPSTQDELAVPEGSTSDTQIGNEKEVASDKKSTIPRRRRKLTELPIERPKEDLDGALASSDSDLSDSVDSKVEGTRKPKKSGRTTVPGRRKKVNQSTSDLNYTGDNAQVPIAPSALDKEKDVSFDQQGEQQLASFKPDPLVAEIDNVRYDEDSSESDASKQDLTAVFQDAELRLDEILVDSRVPAERSDAEPAIHDELGFTSDDSSKEDRGIPSLAEDTPETDEPPLPAFAVASPQASSSTLLFAVGGVGLLLLLLVSTGAAIGWMYFYSGFGFSIDQPDDPPVITDPAANAPPGMAYVPGGEFMMGSDDGDIVAKPAHLVKVDPFYMDITEVTNEEYKKFVDATKHKPPPDWRNGTFPKGKSRFPVINVNWDDASAYAKWAQKRLPTEQEWEFAARGTDGRKYPWGDKWDPKLANAGPTKAIREVGKGADASPFGILDMSGNVWEWTDSTYASYPGGKDIHDATNKKVLRGGCYLSNPDQATTTFRFGWLARGAKEYDDSGFRCVMDLRN